MTEEQWPLHQPVAAHMAAFDLVGFSRNLTDSHGLLHERNALFSAVEETMLFAKLARSGVFAQFLGDELRVAIRRSAVEHAASVFDFAEAVQRNLQKFGGAEGGAQARGVVVSGTVEARESLGCRYLSGPAASKVQSVMNSGLVGGGEVATDAFRPGSRVIGETATLAYVTTVYNIGDPRAEPSSEPCPQEGGRHCFVVGVACRAAAADGTGIEQALHIISDALESSQVERNGMRVSVSPTAAMLAFEDDTVDRANHFLRALREMAVRGGPELSAVLTKGSLVSVQRPWISLNFEGAAAIVAARVLAKLPSGALAVFGEDLDRFYEVMRGLPSHEVTGKRGERFPVKLDAKHFVSGAGVSGSPKSDSVRVSALAGSAGTASAPLQTQVKRALFDIYDEECQPFYLVRKIDEQVSASLRSSGIWISGPAGVGKTTCIRHALSTSHSKFAYIGFANCVGTTVEGLLHHAYFELGELLNPKLLERAPGSQNETIAILARLLATAKYDYVYVDELPTDSAEIHAGFARAFAGLVIAHGSIAPGATLRWVVSSIHSPIGCFELTQKLIFERIRFVEMERWSSEDLEGLLRLACGAISLPLSSIEISRICAASQGSPRFAKNCVRKLAAIGAGWTVDRAIESTSRELL